jgi:hypothetical protein
MGKSRKQVPIRFEIGSHGGCEALLFEFRDNLVRFMDDEPDEATDLSEPHVVQIAARTFDEAFEYLRWREPNFVINRVENLGLILIVSGSPVD